MDNHNGNKFFDGFLLGAVVGGAAVFLLGTKTGKNLLKIMSEQGLEGFINLLEEYDFGDLEEMEEVEPGETGPDPKEEYFEEVEQKDGALKEEKTTNEGKKPLKRRFFRKIRK